MAKFNLNKMKKEADSVAPYPKRLEQQTADHDLSNEGQKIETIQGMLTDNRKEGGAEPTTAYENLMDADRKDNPTTIAENQLDNSDSYWPHRQHDELRPHIKPNDLLAESQDQRYYDKFANDEEAANTAFWDQEIGVQLSGEKTTIVGQVPDSGSQLQNHPDRFKATNERDRADGVDPADSDSAVKDDGKMTMASALQDLDGQLFQIYYKAAKAKRDLTKDENEKIAEITEKKTILLSGE